MVSIQERFIIKSGLWWCAYHSWLGYNSIRWLILNNIQIADLGRGMKPYAMILLVDTEAALLLWYIILGDRAPQLGQVFSKGTFLYVTLCFQKVFYVTFLLSNLIWKLCKIISRETKNWKKNPPSKMIIIHCILDTFLLWMTLLLSFSRIIKWFLYFNTLLHYIIHGFR